MFTCFPFFVAFIYVESRLKITHCLFKWCHRLKAVFFAVHWLRVLGKAATDFTE